MLCLGTGDKSNRDNSRMFLALEKEKFGCKDRTHRWDEHQRTFFSHKSNSVQK